MWQKVCGQLSLTYTQYHCYICVKYSVDKLFLPSLYHVVPETYAMSNCTVYLGRTWSVGRCQPQVPVAGLVAWCQHRSLEKSRWFRWLSMASKPLLYVISLQWL